MVCRKSLSEKLKERYSGNQKKTFKERAAAFGTKAVKAYNAANKGLDKVEGFIYGKPQKKSSAAKSRTSGRPPERKPAGMSEEEYDNWYEEYYTWRSFSPSQKKKPAKKPARKPAKKSAAKSTAKRSAQAYPKVVYVPYPIYPSPLPKVKRQTKSRTAKKKTTKRK